MSGWVDELRTYIAKRSTDSKDKLKIKMQSVFVLSDYAETLRECKKQNCGAATLATLRGNLGGN